MMIRKVSRVTTGALMISLMSSAAMAQTVTPNVLLTYPTGTLPQVGNASSYPRLLMSTQRADAYLTSTNSNVAYLRARFIADVQAYVAQEQASPGVFTRPYIGNSDDILYDNSGFEVKISPILNELALYLYIYDRSLDTAAVYSDATTAANARTLFHTIMVNWGIKSFHNSDGTPLAHIADFSTNDAVTQREPQSVERSQMLHIGRMLTQYTNALDMIQGDAHSGFSAAEINAMTNFVVRMKGIVLESINFAVNPIPSFGVQVDDCGEYENQNTNGREAVIAASIETGDTDTVNALVGAPSGVSLVAPNIPQMIEGSIYGNNDTVRSCPDNTFGTQPTVFTESTLWQTTTPAAGEIVDRYRLGPAKAFGYTESVMLNNAIMDQMLVRAGYDLTKYVGSKGNSLQLALDYYAQFTNKYVSWNPVVLPATDTTIPDFAQYANQPFGSQAAGAAVSGKDGTTATFIIAAQLYPQDTALTSLYTTLEALANAQKNPQTGAIPVFAYVFQDAEMYSAFQPPMANY